MLALELLFTLDDLLLMVEHDAVLWLWCILPTLLVDRESRYERRYCIKRLSNVSDLSKLSLSRYRSGKLSRN